MNKQIKGLCAALLLSLALPLQALAATDAATTFQSSGDQAQVTVALNNSGAGEDINALQMELDVQVVAGSLDQAEVSFVFDEALPGTIQRYDYDESNQVLTVYVAGAEDSIFSKDTVTLGTIQVTSTNEDYLEVSVSAGGMEQKDDHSGLILISGGTSTVYPTMQQQNTVLTSGKLSPEQPEVTPTSAPSATATPAPGVQQTPAPTAAPGATATPAPGVTTPEATATPNAPATSQEQGGSNQSGTAVVPSTGGAVAPAKPSTGKKPVASSSSEVVDSSEVASSEPAASSSEVASEEPASSSQPESEETTAQQEKSSVNPLLIAAGVVAVLAVVALVVILMRRPTEQ
ncbi:MAG: hypothetical protein H9882_07380 [Candidatus Fournierella pullistercoris]|uniref:Cohesin domain-containing protein n=1 Tax=Candidatus Allofournierella pullistercoris TaxID=2838597 RepID=A0A948WV07_9FIRM|nr:hypothetical protein [Candidatus Fournierella pullistercoris]